MKKSWASGGSIRRPNKYLNHDTFCQSRALFPRAWSEPPLRDMRCDQLRKLAKTSRGKSPN